MALYYKVSPSQGPCCVHCRDDCDEVLLKVDSAHIYRHGDVNAIDLESEEFQGLPHEVQHELLLHRQEAEKYTRHNPASLPQVGHTPFYERNTFHSMS